VTISPIPHPPSPIPHPPSPIPHPPSPISQLQSPYCHFIPHSSSFILILPLLLPLVLPVHLVATPLLPALDARLSLPPNNLSTYSFLLLIILGFMGRIRFRQPPEESHVQAGER
jgi:hypothetical protein